MYLIYCLLIWMFVYCFPALALFPRLIFTPLTAFAIPIISTFIIYAFTSLVIATGIFNAFTTAVIALALAGVAIFRLFRLFPKIPLLWTKYDGFIYAIHCIILFPYFIRLGTHAFDRGDEIYSWNFWAIQHYFGELIDFSATHAPYPQLFPKLLAFCYHFLGNLDLQLPIKATLIIFPWALLTGIAVVTHYRFGVLKGAYWLLLIFVLKIVGFAQFFDDGYADPAMTSGLLVSIILFWLGQQHSLFMVGPYARIGLSPLKIAALSVMCALMAAFTKQAALIWTACTLPVLLSLVAFEKKDWRYATLGGFSLGGALIWMLTEGNRFYANPSVFVSQSDRNTFEQLIYALNKYFIHHPALLLLFGFALWASNKDKILNRIYIGLMIPGIICWFLFGAYQLRLGQHLIAVAFFIWAASGRFQFSFKKWEPSFKAIWVSAVAISLSIGFTLFIKEFWVKKDGLNLYAGGRQSLHRYFGKDTDYIYTHLYSNPEAVLWVPSRYLYALFYKHTQLVTPDYSHGPYTRSTIIQELQQTMPDYAFTVSPTIEKGPASELLKEVIGQCPSAFEVVSEAKNKYSFTTYKIDKVKLNNDACLIEFALKDNKEKAQS